MVNEQMALKGGFCPRADCPVSCPYFICSVRCLRAPWSSVGMAKAFSITRWGRSPSLCQLQSISFPWKSLKLANAEWCGSEFSINKIFESVNNQNIPLPDHFREAGIHPSVESMRCIEQKPEWNYWFILGRRVTSPSMMYGQSICNLTVHYLYVLAEVRELSSCISSVKLPLMFWNEVSTNLIYCSRNSLWKMMTCSNPLHTFGQGMWLQSVEQRSISTNGIRSQGIYEKVCKTR